MLVNASVGVVTGPRYGGCSRCWLIVSPLFTSNMQSIYIVTSLVQPFIKQDLRPHQMGVLTKWLSGTKKYVVYRVMLLGLNMTEKQYIYKRLELAHRRLEQTQLAWFNYARTSQIKVRTIISVNVHRLLRHWFIHKRTCSKQWRRRLSMFSRSTTSLVST